jgi:hypothetical protein
MLHVKSRIAAALLCTLALAPGVAAEAPKSAADTQVRVGKLIAELSHAKFGVREAATKSVIAIGAPAVPELKRALTHGEPEVRRRARVALDAIMISPEYLQVAIQDPDKDVRKQAIQNLEQLGERAKKFIPLLAEAIKDKDEEVREAAMLALVAIDPDNKAVGDAAAIKASVNGKYGKLLRRIHVPRDKANYTEFRDYGQYQATDYAGHQNIPAGYWVYVYPHWYIWGEQKK